MLRHSWVPKRNSKLFNGFRGPLLNGTHPPLWQTPGKVQYYKAEMEPYVPGKKSISKEALSLSLSFDHE